MLLSKKLQTLIILTQVLFTSGCSQTSPRHETSSDDLLDGLLASDIFAKTFEKHGGNHLDELNDVNVAIDGEWYFLITKIQPDLTDETYRQRSEERLLLSPMQYNAHYQGSAGTKQVLRTHTNITLAYDQTINDDAHKQAATALTADSFYLFTLGPLALKDRVKDWKRLPDAKENHQTYFRINGELKPGIGLSESDAITLWVNKETYLSYRLNFTLDGFQPTQGAHIDTTYEQYQHIDPFILPTKFLERVRAPIKLKVHQWWYTGLDINRGLDHSDLPLNKWSDKALKPASSMPPSK